MSDMMMFPDTVEEFMENYKIVDTDEVYTNGVELVPIFRMKQWFEHLPSVQPEIIRCKDCKYNLNGPDAGNADCNQFYGMTYQMGFCHCAERRTDE